jgi:hypothetical protein
VSAAADQTRPALALEPNFFAFCQVLQGNKAKAGKQIPAAVELVACYATVATVLPCENTPLVCRKGMGLSWKKERLADRCTELKVQSMGDRNGSASSIARAARLWQEGRGTQEPRETKCQVSRAARGRGGSADLSMTYAEVHWDSATRCTCGPTASPATTTQHYYRPAAPCAAALHTDPRTLGSPDVVAPAQEHHAAPPRLSRPPRHLLQQLH